MELAGVRLLDGGRDEDNCRLLELLNPTVELECVTLEEGAALLEKGGGSLLSCATDDDVKMVEKLVELLLCAAGPESAVPGKVGTSRHPVGSTNAAYVTTQRAVAVGRVTGPQAVHPASAQGAGKLTGASSGIDDG